MNRRKKKRKFIMKRAREMGGNEEYKKIVLI
jgi:hypothetical protein